METQDFTVIRSGFDTLELAYRCAIPERILDVLETAKKQAREGHRTVPLEIGNETVLVEGSGGQGGYAYRFQHGGPFGAIWKFREKGSKDPWFAHVKVRAYGLATKGLLQSKADCDAFLTAIGAGFDANDARVARADFAIDVYAPGLTVEAQHILAHARSTKADLPERTMRGDRTNYLRIGKLPGKQLAVYDKSQAVKDKRDLIWKEIFKQRLYEVGFSNKLIEALPDIWRIEFRAGRNFLTSQLKMRRWDKFLNLKNTVFQNLAKSYSWKKPTADINRSRWPTHPIWPLVQNELANLRFQKLETGIPSKILKILKEEYVEGLERQHEGLLLTLAAAKHIKTKELDEFISSSGHHSLKSIKCRREYFSDFQDRKEYINSIFQN